MKRFTWGHGIAIFLILFVSILIFVLLKSMQMDHSLVANNYYERDLTFQDRFEKVKRQKSNDNLVFSYNKKRELLTLRFKEEELSLSGIATFYRPSDSTLDFQIPIDKNEINIEVGQIMRGRWIVQVEWSENNVSYYMEKDIYI